MFVWNWFTDVLGFLGENFFINNQLINYMKILYLSIQIMMIPYQVCGRKVANCCFWDWTTQEKPLCYTC